MATLEDLEGTVVDLKARIATLELSRADYRTLVEAIKAFGDTQTMLADVLREYISGLRSMADDSNQRIRSLEKSAAEIKDLLARTPDF